MKFSKPPSGKGSTTSCRPGLEQLPSYIHHLPPAQRTSQKYRRHVGKYPCKVADGVLLLHIHSPPTSRRPAFRHLTGPSGVRGAPGFHFHPGPCIQFSGVKRSATPSGPNNVPPKRQSDTGPLRSRPETAHPAMPAHRQECRGLLKPETGASQPLQGPSGQRTGTGGARGGPVSHPSRIATDQRKPDSSSPRPALRSPDCHPPPLIFAMANSRNATGCKSSLTVAATNIGDGPKAPDPLNIRLNGRLLRRPVPACGNGSGQARLPEPLYGCFRGWFRAGAPPVMPSAQPFSPPPRSTDGAHIDRSGPTGCRQPLHQCQTQGYAYEATRAGRARPDGGRAWAGSTPAPVSSGHSASIRRPKPPGRPSNGTPEHTQTL